jgi:hypothetical protein
MVCRSDLVWAVLSAPGRFFAFVDDRFLTTGS